MTLLVHHLQVSQSERIVWLCEELGIAYELKTYQRSPVFSPPEYKALHPIGAAPVIQDGDVTIAESGACAEYIINIYGGGKLTVKPGAKNYADYLYWLHFANGTLQPAITRCMSLQFAGVGAGNSNAVVSRFEDKLRECVSFLNERLGETGAWLAGSEFTVADIMTVFSLTTMREFYQLDLSAHSNVLAYLQRVASREGYQRAMKKGDPELNVQDLIKGPGPQLFGPLQQL